MLYDPSTTAPLQAWLVKTLEPICDAEPEALATYILALLKHEVPEQDLKQEVTKQLDEFFENGASGFVETLFSALRSKSYVPYTTIPSYTPSAGKDSDSGIPIPLEALIRPSTSISPERGRKRGYDSNDHESRGPPKGPRLSNEAYFSRGPHANGHGNPGNSGNWQRGPMDGQRGDMMMNGGATGGGMNGGNNQRTMLPRGVCRDYHLKGFCSRGAMCKYSHDDIGFMPPMPIPMNGGALPFLGMFGGLPFGMPQPQQAYDPYDALMDMSPQGQFIPGLQNRENGQQMYGGTDKSLVIQDLTSRSATGNQAPQDSQAMNGSLDTQIHAPEDVSSQNGSSQSTSFSQPGTRPQRGGGFRGRGRGSRGTFGGDHQNFNGGNAEQGRNNKTIVVEKIPDDHLSLEAVNNWFKRYGTVTNVAVDAIGKKALVSFSSNEEARAAWGTEEAVFNNRFVKIFWHRPLEGQGNVGTRALQASASLVANLASRENVSPPVPNEPAKPSTSSTTPKHPVSSSSTKTANALEAKQQLLEKQIAEQKELMSKLATATGDEKKEIMTRLRKLAAEMKSPALETSSTSSSLSQPKSATQGGEDNEKRKKELLDMELDIHSKTSNETPKEVEETTENLKEKLEKLRAEASALGIADPSSPTTTYAPPYRGAYRGRGRGRGFRGVVRGGPPRGSMTLDNRPKALLLKELSARDNETEQSVRAWYSTGLTSLEALDNNSMVAIFQSRNLAEQALAKGTNIPSVGSVKISWHTVTNPPPPSKPTSTPQVPETKQPTAEDERQMSPEEIPDDSGWGNEDDGMF